MRPSISFETANALLKSVTIPYDRKGRDAFIDDLIHAYPKDTVAALGEGGSDSEQTRICPGHAPFGHVLDGAHTRFASLDRGAGELPFWYAARGAARGSAAGLLDLPTRKKLAEDCLRLLETHGAMRCESSTRPRLTRTASASFIRSSRMRDSSIWSGILSIRACPAISNRFVAALSFCADLSDLAHYYSGHRRLMKHWQSVLPAENLLVVPYEGLVADHEGWTRKMLDFLGIDWNDRCLSFRTPTVVVTASAWQVRQKDILRLCGPFERLQKVLRAAQSAQELTALGMRDLTAAP